MKDLQQVKVHTTIILIIFFELKSMNADNTKYGSSTLISIPEGISFISRLWKMKPSFKSDQEFAGIRPDIFPVSPKCKVKEQFGSYLPNDRTWSSFQSLTSVSILLYLHGD